MTTDESYAHDPDETMSPEDMLLFEFINGLDHAADMSRYVDGFCERHPDRAQEFRGHADIERRMRPKKTPPIPERLADFRIVRVIGKGGMGYVCEAEEFSLKRRVALKVIQPRGGRILPEAESRFENEQIVLGKLHHTNIVAIYSNGRETVDGQTVQYFAMPLIDGVSLDHVVHTARCYPSSRSGGGTPSLDGLVRMNRDDPENEKPDGPPPANFDESSHQPKKPHSVVFLRSVAECVMKVARAVEHAHRRGVLHRDLKPHNVMVDATGECFVIDFGLARLVNSRSDGRPDLPFPSLPHEPTPVEGTAGIGTPHYRSPEQVRGVVDVRTDVWGLGTILYELLTLSRPYKQDDVTDDMLLKGEHFKLLKPPREVAPSVPRDLAAICRRCLELEPERRYQSAGAVADDLDNWLRDQPVVARRRDLMERVDRIRKFGRRHPVITWSSAIVAAAVSFFVWLILIHNRELEAAYSDEQVQRGEAQSQRDRARDESTKAKALAEENRRRLVRLYVANGRHSYESGDPLGALSWFAAALRLEGEDSGRGAAHRLRLGSMLNIAPKLNWSRQGTSAIVAVKFSPNGRDIAIADADNAVQIWNTKTNKAITLPMRHSQRINSLRFSPNGKQVAVGCDDGTVTVRSASTGKPIFPPVKTPESVVRALYTPDGRYLVTASSLVFPAKKITYVKGIGFRGRLPRISNPDYHIQVLDATTGRTLRHPGKGTPVAIRSKGWLHHVQVSPDGTKIAAAIAGPGRRDRDTLEGLYDDRVMVWETTTASPVGRPLSVPYYIRRLRFSPDDAQVAAVYGEPGTKSGLRVWSLSNSRVVGDTVVSDDLLTRLQFNPNGGSLTTASNNGAVCIRYSADGRQRAIGKSHSTRVDAIAYRPDGRVVATGSRDGIVRLSNPATGKQVGALLHHSGEITGLQFSPDGNRLLVATTAGRVRIWTIAPEVHPAAKSLKSSKLIAKIQIGGDNDRLIATTGAFVGITESNGQQTVVSESVRPENIVVWNSATGKTELEWSGKSGIPDADEVRIADFNTKRFVVIAESAKKPTEIQVRNLNDEGSSTPAFTFTGRVHDAKLVPERQLLAVSWSNYMKPEKHVVELIDLSKRAADRRVWRHNFEVQRLFVSPNGRWILTVSRRRTRRTGGTLRLWDVTSGQADARLVEFADDATLRRVVFSPSSKRIAVAFEQRASNQTGRSFVYDIAIGAVIRRFQHPGTVTDLAFSSDGKGLLASSGRTARLWGISTGHPLTPPLLHRQQINRALLTADGRRIITGSEDRSVCVWIIASPDAIGLSLKAGGGIRDVAVSKDGRTLFTSGHDRTLRKYRLTLSDRSVEEWQRLAQTLSSRRIDRTGALVSLETPPVKQARERLRVYRFHGGR